MYMEALETLAGAGLAQYEISNFSRPEFGSRHNLRYWERRPYLGLGLDASSMLRAAPNQNGELRNVLRATTTDDLAAFLEAPQAVETTWHSAAAQHEEAWFLGLRPNAGVTVSELEREFGRLMVEPALAVVTRLVDEGSLVEEDGRIRLTPRGRLLSNDVFQEFLELAPEAELARSGIHS
jgi:oxygen-independent coproporphyrinogen-3 oxidase